MKFHTCEDCGQDVQRTEAVLCQNEARLFVYCQACGLKRLAEFLPRLLPAAEVTTHHVLLKFAGPAPVTLSLPTLARL